MRYVAKKPLTMVGPDGAVYSVLPGQEVVGFADAPYPVRVAHLNQESVVDLNDKRGMLSTEGGRLHFRVYGMVSPPTQQAPVVEPEPEHVVDPDEVRVPGVSCALCDKPYATPRGLKRHMAAAHKEA